MLESAFLATIKVNGQDFRQTNKSRFWKGLSRPHPAAPATEKRLQEKTPK